MLYIRKLYLRELKHSECNRRFYKIIIKLINKLIMYLNYFITNIKI